MPYSFFCRITSLTVLSLFLSLGAHAASHSCHRDGEWLVPGKNAFVSTATLTASLASQQVILLGEQHDIADHHRWQLQTISALYALRPDMALGFEMFPRRIQAVLDKWVAGELSESEFLEQSEWKKVWGYEPALYMPIFHFARMNRIPMLALNIDRSVVRSAGKKGLKQMSEEERQGVSFPAPASDDYLQLLANTFGGHSQGEELESEDILENEQFLRFVGAQQLWDRAMAERLAEAVTADEAPLVIGVMGTGHIVERFGVPQQLADLGIQKTKVLLPGTSTIPCEEITARTADGIFGLPPYEEVKAPAKPLLGVHLLDEDGAIKITQIVEKSVAERCGLKQGDTFVTIAGRIVDSVDDVVSTVQAMPAGAWLPIEVKRNGEPLQFIAKFPLPENHK